MRTLAICLLAGCNSIFGLQDVILVDSPPPSEAGVDAPRLVVPPDGSTTCGALPSFSGWIDEAATITPVIAGREISGLAFYERAGAQRAFVTRTDASGSLGIWDNDLAGTEVRLASLGPPNGGSVSAPSPTPDGEHLWFRQDLFAPGTYYGSRVDGWQKQESTLGFVDVQIARPSPVGFYDGTARMIVQTQDASRNAFVEVSSPDGTTWTELDTFKLTLPGSPIPLSAYLSPDGCVAVVSVWAGAFYKLYIAGRDATGAFSGAPTEIDVSAHGCCPSRPAMTTDLGSLWFIATNNQLVRRHP